MKIDIQKTDLLSMQLNCSHEIDRRAIRRKCCPNPLTKIRAGAIKRLTVIGFLSFFLTNKVFADYTVALGSPIDASTITPAQQTGTLFINGTLTVSSNVSLSGFTAVVITGPNGRILWNTNTDLSFSAGILFDINSPGTTGGLQLTGGSAAKSLTIGSTVIAVSNSSSNNAAYSFAEFNAGGGLPKFAIASSPSSPATICYGTSFTATITPQENIVAFDYYWSCPTTGTSFTPAGSPNFASSTTAKTVTFNYPVSASANTYILTYKITRAGDNDPILINTLQVTVNPAPAIPTLVAATNATICGGSSTNLNATSSGNSINWYTTSTGGILLGNSASAANFPQSPAATTIYYAESKIAGTGCPSLTRVPVTVTVHNPVVITSTTTNSFCVGSNSSMTVNTTGTASGYQWQVSTTGVGGAYNDVSAALYTTYTTPTLNIATPTVTPMSSNFYRVVITPSVCPAVISTPVALKFANVWIGTVSTDWNNAANWSDGTLPSTGCPNVYIQSTTNKPILGSSTATITNLNIFAGGKLTVNGTGKLQIGGAISNAGTFDVSDGNLEFNGLAAQNFSGNIFLGNTLNNLTASNPGGLSVTGSGIPLNIKGVLGFGASNDTLNTGDNIVLRSTATTTARVADITNGGVNLGNQFVGKVTVERYFPGHRSWYLITAPIYDGGSNFDNWQNGAGAYVPGKGIFVTGSKPTTGSDGLDVGPFLNSTLKTYNNSVYTEINNTKMASLTTGATSAANIPYFVFIRGDRLPQNFTPPNTNPTTISSTGRLQTGRQVFSVDPVAESFSMVGNPYASPVDYKNLITLNLPRTFYIFDPHLNVTGGYVTFSELSLNSGTYIKSPLGSSATPIIQSGQAFFVNNFGGGLAQVEFNEANKSSANNLSVFRPMSPESMSSLAASIFIFDSKDSAILSDGNFAQFDDSFNAGVDLQDAKKLLNTNETFSIQNDKKSLVVDRRPMPTMLDTVYYKLTNTTAKKYQFEFVATNLERDNLAGFVQDQFMHTATPMNMNGITKVNFAVTSNNASAAADRFRVVFKPSVVYTSVAANVLASDIGVQWNVNREENIKGYEIERSTDGTHFTKVGDQPSAGNTEGAVAYNWLDVSPALGQYYYRIRSISYNDVIGYSNIVKVKLNRSTSAIYVFPNPVTENTIHLQMNGMAKGVYAVRLMNSLGQVVVSNYIAHMGGTATETITPANKILAGIYQLEISAPDKKLTTIKVIVQ